MHENANHHYFYNIVYLLRMSNSYKYLPKFGKKDLIFFCKNMNEKYSNSNDFTASE